MNLKTLCKEKPIRKGHICSIAFTGIAHRQIYRDIKWISAGAIGGRDGGCGDSFKGDKNVL